MAVELLERERCYSIVGGFLEVFHYFGPGLAESVYTGALVHALEDRGHHVAREVGVEILFKGRPVAWQRLDMVVDERIIIEVKVAEKLAAYAQAQVVSYLRATRFEVGLLLHVGRSADWKRFIDSPKRSPYFRTLVQAGPEPR
jgi:GxxExxY protein